MRRQDIYFTEKDHTLYKSFRILNSILILLGITPYVLIKSDKTTNKFVIKRKYQNYVILNRICCILIALVSLPISKFKCENINQCVFEILQIVHTVLIVVIIPIV